MKIKLGFVSNINLKIYVAHELTESILTTAASANVMFIFGHQFIT